MTLCGLSIFGDARYRDAARPLFDAGEVEAVEWSVDSWEAGDPHPETSSILKSFGGRNALIGHGVHYPVLAAKPDDLRGQWLGKLAEDVKQYSYNGLSVHFGFATGWELAEGAPLPVPLCDRSLSLGVAALKELAMVAPCRIGLENLALSFSKAEALEQGRFIDRLLEPVDGYLLLDLHNIYCQSHNFGVPMAEMAKTYPLHRVIEIHVAGGSWSDHGNAVVRRDTHDGRVPQEVLAALPAVMELCPKLECVMLEKLPFSFTNDDDAENFRADFRRMKTAVRHG